MSEDVARSLAAAAGTVTINGKTRKLRPLTVRELAEVERECVKYKRRQYMEGYADSIDCLPAGTDKMALLMKKADEVARWEVRDLPRQTIYDPAKLTVTPALQTAIDAVAGANPGRTETEYRTLAAVVMNTGAIGPAAYKEATGEDAPAQSVSYVQWWVTGCFAGMVVFLAACIEDDNLPRKEIEDYIANSHERAAQVTRELEAVSSPRTDFGAPPAAAGAKDQTGCSAV